MIAGRSWRFWLVAAFFAGTHPLVVTSVGAWRGAPSEGSWAHAVGSALLLAAMGSWQVPGLGLVLALVLVGAGAAAEGVGGGAGIVAGLLTGLVSGWLAAEGLKALARVSPTMAALLTIAAAAQAIWVWPSAPPLPPPPPPPPPAATISQLDVFPLPLGDTAQCSAAAPVEGRTLLVEGVASGGRVQLEVRGVGVDARWEQAALSLEGGDVFTARYPIPAAWRSWRLCGRVEGGQLLQVQAGTTPVTLQPAPPLVWGPATTPEATGEITRCTAPRPWVPVVKVEGEVPWAASAEEGPPRRGLVLVARQDRGRRATLTPLPSGPVREVRSLPPGHDDYQLCFTSPTGEAPTLIALEGNFDALSLHK